MMTDATENQFQEADKDYEEALLEFRLKCLSIIQEAKEQLHFLDLNRIKKETSQKSDKLITRASKSTWSTFAQKYQISPTRTNNNISSHCGQNHTLSKLKVKANGVNIDNQRNINFTRLLLCAADLTFSILLFSIISFVKILIVCFLFYCLLVHHAPTQAFISRNSQSLIYPFMRNLRLFTLPIIRQFPSLTDLYEESCLFTNPFYATDNLDCWPCESVRHVFDLTGFSNFSTSYHHSGIPFIVKDAFRDQVSINDLRKIYSMNRELMGAVFFESNTKRLNTFKQLFSPEGNVLLKDPHLHISWKINRVTMARILRKHFPKPYFVPSSTETSVQHYLFIDRKESNPYLLPLTEFANVFVTQAAGSRTIVLIPITVCQNSCKVVSVVLFPKDVLFYNWLYWRPVSLPNNSSDESVTYMGSFY